MEITGDLSRGAWLRDRLGHAGTDISTVVGNGFEAYVRILHPVEAHLTHPTERDEWGMPKTLKQTRWRWADVAAQTGRIMHPLVQWRSLTNNETELDWLNGWSVSQTIEGFFEPDLLAALTEHLRGATRTPEDLVAGVWPGFGEFNGSQAMVYVAVDEDAGVSWESAQQAAEDDLARSVSAEVRRAVAEGRFLTLPGREYFLLTTTLDELSDPGWTTDSGLGWGNGLPGVTPQLLWPEDHAWLMATEIDFDSTLVAGPRGLIDAVLSDNRFEAYEVEEHDRLTYDADTINPPPTAGY